jgi:hypothetical protein
MPSIMAQVFVVVAAGSVIAFIVRDLGDGAVAGWIIQVPPPLIDSLWGCPLTADAGSFVDAKRTFTYCRAPFRCP